MHINTVIQNATLDQLFLEVAQNAKTEMSFLGTRSIRVLGYKGIAPIDSLAARIITLVQSKNFKYTLQEREVGSLISRQINRIYKDSDTQEENSNCVTRLICFMREFSYNCALLICPPRAFSAIRWYWEENSYYSPMGDDGYHNVFKYYTPEQFLERYGREPTRSEMHSMFGIRGKNFPNVSLAQVW